MINKIELVALSGRNMLADSVVKLNTSDIEYGVEFSIEFLDGCEISELYIEVSFDSPIKKWRNSDYTWHNLSDVRLIANDFSPKILSLSNGFKIVAQNNQGCWEYDPTSDCFRWFFFHPMLTPTLRYDQNNKRIFRDHQNISKGTKILSGLLWSQGEVEEWARTPLGFVPTVCFTDHSDFDTLSNLKKQREFFKECGVVVSKGFFLYDYSHKGNTASFEQESTKSELQEWKSDGHEMVYHAFSQSYRGSASEQEYMSFESPKELSPINCYIDHGFHPYNFTKQVQKGLGTWYAHMEGKGVNLIWNYIDSGEGNFFCINQLNAQDFRLVNLWRSFRENKAEGISRKWVALFRNILMFGIGEEALSFSKKIKTDLTLLKRQKRIQHLGTLLNTCLSTMKKFIQPQKDEKFVLGKNEVFPFSKFGPVFFEAPDQKNTQIYIFQSISVRDFDVVFSEKALRKLIDEKGVLIAHTYFSFLGLHHEGRFFHDENWSVRDSVAKNFRQLGDLIKKGGVWNPCISELFAFYLKTKKMTYRNENGNLVIDNFEGVKRII